MSEQLKAKIYPDLPSEDLSFNSALSFQSLPQDTEEFQSLGGPAMQPEQDPVKDLTPNNENVPPCPAVQKHYRGFLEDYIEKINEILEKFAEIKKRAEDHHYKSNCAKVSGTVVSSTGVALVMGSLWWAPLTAGSSLVLGAGGAVMSVTGSLTNVLTDYIAYKTTASILEDIKLLLKEKEAFDIWMRKSLKNFNECIVHLMASGISREIAISTVIEGIAKGAIDIMEKPNDKVMASLSTAIKLHHVQHIATEALPVIGKTFHLTEKSFQFVYNILGLTGRTVPTLLKDFAKISGILSVALAMADISILIKDLCSEHPSIDIIENVVGKLKDERSVLLDLLNILKAVEKNEDGIFERAMKDIELLIDKEDLLHDFIIVNDSEFEERAGVSVE